MTPLMVAHSDENPYQAPTAPVAGPAEAEAPPEILPLASRRRRLAAFLIDAIVGYVGAYLLALVPFIFLATYGQPLRRRDSEVFETLSVLGLSAIWFLFALVYPAIFESSRLQATLGKRIFAIKLTDTLGRRISPRCAFARSFVKLLSAMIYGLGFLWVFFNKRRQALHDRVAGTIVVRAMGESE